MLVGRKVIMEAALGISVFPDNPLYDVAVTRCMGRVPASVYITAQGGYPKTAPGSGLDTRAKIFAVEAGYENGIAQETCCDSRIWYFFCLAYCGDEPNPGQWIVHREYRHEAKLRASSPLEYVPTVVVACSPEENGCDVWFKQARLRLLIGERNATADALGFGY